MAHDYETSKKVAVKIISILAIITIVEVGFALLGKGYIFEGFHVSVWIMGGVMILFSAVKAYLIIYEFMHMKYEVPGLVKSVLLPMFLLVWGVIAFLYEGSDWNSRRQLINNKNSEEIANQPQTTGMIYEIKKSEI